jgi:RHS repeat-associated protein
VYDQFGRLIRRSINGDDNTTAIKYDQLGRVVSETNLLGEFDFAYPEQNGEPGGSNRIASIKYPNQTEVQFKYNGSSGEERLQSIISSKLGQSDNLCRFDYSYDNAGQISEWKEQFGNEPASQLSLRYDAAGQLTDATSQTGSLDGKTKEYHFSYDLASNRIKSHEIGTIRELGYNSMNELISAAARDTGSSQPQSLGETAAKLEYDLNGNLIKDGNLRYSWDAENRLIGIDFADGSHTAFQYDALGQRTRIVETAGSKITSAKTLIWNSGRICEERTDSGQHSTRLFTLGENLHGKNYYYQRDHLGSTRQMIDQDGTVQSRIDYDPFGKPTVTGGNIVPSVQYASYVALGQSGLYLTPFRAYDSKLGRWLSRDPLGEFGLQREPEWTINNSVAEITATNLYSYASNNSMNLIDPSGLQNSPYQSKDNGSFGQIQAPTATGQSQISGTPWAGLINWFSGSNVKGGSDSLSNQPAATFVNPAANVMPVNNNGIVNIGPAPAGSGLQQTIPGPAGTTLNLVGVTNNNLGVYGYNNYPAYVTKDPATGQPVVMQNIPNGAQTVDSKGQILNLKSGPAKCTVQR